MPGGLTRPLCLGEEEREGERERDRYIYRERERERDIYIYMVTPPPMIHTNLLFNYCCVSYVLRCLVVEYESIGIYGVFCTSCTCIPDSCIPLHHMYTSRNRNQILVSDSSYAAVLLVFCFLATVDVQNLAFLVPGRTSGSCAKT